MFSIISHPHTTLMRASWTHVRLPRLTVYGLYLTSGTAYSDHSTRGVRAVFSKRLTLIGGTQHRLYPLEKISE
jgi:hypothetical protein